MVPVAAEQKRHTTVPQTDISRYLRVRNFGFLRAPIAALGVCDPPPPFLGSTSGVKHC
jgi:hypothetical protein